MIPPILKSTIPLCGLICASALTTSLSAAILITGFNTSVNDRFAEDNEDTFIAKDSNLSGVAIANDGRWVTMLSSNVFVTANHFASPVNTYVTFYKTNNPLDGSFTTTIQNSQQLDNTDIQLGVLSSPLPAGYNAYSIFNYPDPPTSTDVTVKMFGRSESDFPISQDMAIGQNVMDSFTSNQTVGSNTTDSGETTLDSDGDPNFLPYEAQLATYDSGAPVMVDSGDGLTIIGLNWYIGETDDDPAKEISGFSYLPSYISEIEDFIEDNPPPSVPEPTTSALLIGLAIASATVTRRRRNAHP